MRKALTVMPVAAAMATMLAVAVPVAAGEQAPAKDGAAATTIAGRQSAFLMSAALFGSIKAAVERGDPVKTQGFPARALARWAKTVPAMFPAGSTSATSEALPTIWSDSAGFARAAADYAAATDRLAALAKAEDQAGFAAQVAVVGKSCGGCHDSYRKPEDKH